jgi:hypothetical protein
MPYAPSLPVNHRKLRAPLPWVPVRLRGKERRHLAVVRRLGFDGKMPSLLSGIHEPSRTAETDARWGGGRGVVRCLSFIPP